ncbi:hypothetical protein ACS106_004371 [Escherichia coli]
MKLIYRPKSLAEGRKDAEKAMQIVYHDGETYLRNLTPYYFAVTAVKVNGLNVKLKDSVLNNIAQLAPENEVALGNMALNGAVSVTAVKTGAA